MAKRFKDIKQWNSRRKLLTAEKELDILILKETLALESKNFKARRKDAWWQTTCAEL